MPTPTPAPAPKAPSFVPSTPGFLGDNGSYGVGQSPQGITNPNINPSFTPSDAFLNFTKGINEGQGGTNPYDNTYQNAAGIPGQNPLQDMLARGKLQPFLQRIFDQYRGNAANGTNVPQQTNLPRSVPLLSKMAYAQLSPSELQAFQSYLSAYGVDPKDYEAMVENASPHGGSGSALSRTPQWEFEKQ